MKKNFTSAVLAFLLCGGSAVFAQNKQSYRVATKEQMTKSVTYKAALDQERNFQSEDLISNKVIVPTQNNVGSAVQGIQTVSPVAIGRASNAYSILRTEQNQVFADQATNVVGFIHRQDVTVHGGGGAESGKLRYDLSIDGGQTFTTDIGVLNAAYTRPARYPNAALYNPGAGSNPFDATIVYAAPVLNPSPDWDGHVNGAGVLSNTAYTGTENYNSLGAGTLLPGGLTEGLDGEFWTTDAGYTGSDDTIFIYKGVFNASSQDFDWTRVEGLYPNYNISFDGNPRIVGPNIAFSPDGQTGWVGMLSDLAGGSDTTYNPTFIKSTDGGASWGAPVEVNMDAIGWIADSLQSLWVDSLGDPASSGRATGAFDYDITVDADGNVHMGLVIGSASTTTSGPPSYSIYSGIGKFYADIYTPDGGATWDARYIGPVLAFRGEFGQPDANGDLLNMDNMPQISRTEDGSHIFYSWVDTDTTGQFGESNNLAPNLRIAGYRLSDDYQTCFKRITDDDLTWNGAVLYPTMAPTVLKSGDTYILPIVTLEMLQNDQLQQCQFHSFTRDALIFDSDFQDPNSLSLGYDGACFPVSTPDPVDVNEGITLGQSSPNPNTGVATIKFELPSAMSIEMDIVNLYGQQVGTIATGNFNAGQHEVSVNSSELAPGVYFYNLRTSNKVYTKKMIVVK